MATLNPGLILQGQPYKAPSFDMGDTLVQMARLKAYRQQHALEELKLGQAQRAQDRQQEFEQIMAGVFTPPQAPQPGLSPQGPPQGPPPGQPPPGGMPGLPSADRGLTMAQQVPPATPQQGNYASMPPTAGPRGLSEYGMAPIDLQSRAGLEAQAGPGPAMNAGMTEAPPGAAMPARGLGAPASGAPPPPSSGGLGEATPKRSQIPGLNQPLNEQVLMRAFSVNPEATGKWLTGYTEMQGKKLEQVEKVNEVIYQNLKALEQSPDPAGMYPEMLKSLRASGVPVPENFPTTYQPALMQFLLQSHRGVKVELDEAKTGVERYKQISEQWNAKKAQSDISVDQARKADLQSQIDKRTSDIGKTDFEIARDKKLAGVQVPEYVKGDPDMNSLLHRRMLEAGETGTPSAPIIAQARQDSVLEKQAVIREHGLSAVKEGNKAIGEASKERLKVSNARGTSGEQVMNALDEVERLIDEGVYENVPSDQTKMAAYWAGFRPDDAKAARTRRLYQLGHQLTLANTTNGSLGAGFSDTDRNAVAAAGGDLQASQAALTRKETIKSLRKISQINMDDANHTWDTYNKGHDFPAFGSARKAREKILTQADITEAVQANKWTREQAIANAKQRGFRVED